jgi:hypothetical protein
MLQMLIEYNEVKEVNPIWASAQINSDFISIKNLDYPKYNEYAHPYELMYDDLKTLSSGELFDTKAFQIKISLDLEKYTAWRSYLLPAKISLRQMHEIIVESFSWADYHLHEYVTHDTGGKRIRFVMDEDAFEYAVEGEELILEQYSTLEDLVSYGSEIEYIYDFGDHWDHTIEIEKVIEHYDKNYPVLTGGDYDGPPEDVGGRGGFAEYIDAIIYDNHPEHDDMKQWADGQYWRKPFDVVRINAAISRHIVGGRV